MQADQQEGYSASAKVLCCLCIFFVPLIVIASIFLAQGIDTLKEVQYEQIGLIQDECIIQKYYSYNCDCYNCFESGYQYMYHAIANKTCGDKIILSEKDECQILIDKDIPYTIGDKHTCFMYNCDEYFTFDSPNQLNKTAYIYYGFGIGLLILAFVCCICCIAAIATNRVII